MKNQEVTVRNKLVFRFTVPETVDEYNKAAARPDSTNPCLDDAVANTIYRTGLPDAWGQLAEALFKEHGIARKTKPHTNPEKAAKGETLNDETDPEYVNRVAAQIGKVPVDFQSLVDSFGVLPLDLTERRGQGGPLVGKGDMDMASTFIDAGEEKCNRALERIAQATGAEKVVLSGDRDKDVLAIARALKAYRQWQSEQNKKTLLS